MRHVYVTPSHGSTKSILPKHAAAHRDEEIVHYKPLVRRKSGEGNLEDMLDMADCARSARPSDPCAAFDEHRPGDGASSRRPAIIRPGGSWFYFSRLDQHAAHEILSARYDPPCRICRETSWPITAPASLACRASIMEFSTLTTTVGTRPIPRMSPVRLVSTA